MFLRKLQSRNPVLISEAVKLYRENKIQANSYVLDLDAVESNTRIIADEAKKWGLSVYAMTKQIGRNPEVAKRIAKAGISKFVAVDPWEALILAETGLELGHVGHLVQIPEGMLTEVIRCQPEVITVFSYEKALSVHRAAEKMGVIQPILLKVTAQGDKVYEGQQGGIEEKDWLTAVSKILELTHVKIAGVTSFPCFLYQQEHGRIEEMPNMETLRRAKSKIEREFGILLPQMNTPSANTASSMELVAKAGGTHCEPGHALLGTTPLHAAVNQPEKPAILYMTEVSHIYQGKAYTFFGGHYRRSHMQELALFSVQGEEKGIFQASEMDAESIDYYGSFNASEQVKIGDICIYAFRTQIFTTRSQVVLLDGLSQGKARIAGIYDSQGRSLEKQ